MSNPEKRKTFDIPTQGKHRPDALPLSAEDVHTQIAERNLAIARREKSDTANLDTQRQSTFLILSEVYTKDIMPFPKLMWMGMTALGINMVAAGYHQNNPVMISYGLETIKNTTYWLLGDQAFRHAVKRFNPQP